MWVWKYSKWGTLPNEPEAIQNAERIDSVLYTRAALAHGKIITPLHGGHPK